MTMIGSELIQAGYRYALSLTHNEHNAEDLVQDACFKLLKAHGLVHARPLLFTAIRNLYIDRYRHENVLSFEELHDDKEYPEEDSAPLDFDVSMEELERALATLRPEEREVIYLHYYESYTAQEIGGIVRKPRNTVLSLLARGKKKLAAELAGPGAASARPEQPDKE
jgi:RNA polymerase sigma-70 factor (ECF subfamily)